ncbi:MAG: hypothetical protein QXL57_03210 [Candidatus Bathyarchaeia archaeon]
MHRMLFKLSCAILFLLAAFSVPCVNARGGVFVIGPMQKEVETVELTVSESMHADVCGNISVVNGYIDFYVTNPSGGIILCYNKVSFGCFNFSAVENGTYVLHLANAESENDVTATLNYGVNFKVFVQETLSWHTVATWRVEVTPTFPFDIVGILTQIIVSITLLYYLASLGEKIVGLIRWFYWRAKHGKSKTPVILKLIKPAKNLKLFNFLAIYIKTILI